MKIDTCEAIFQKLQKYQTTFRVYILNITISCYDSPPVMVKWIYKPGTCKTKHFNRINPSGSLRLQDIHQEVQWNQRT